MTLRRAAIALGMSILMFCVGLAGAGLFHPDGAQLVESQVLWQIFGITAYLGIALFWVSALLVVILSAVGVARQGADRRGRGHRGRRGGAGVS